MVNAFETDARIDFLIIYIGRSVEQVIKQNRK